MSETKVSANGVKHLESTTARKKLLLNDTEASDEGVRCISKLPQLEILDLYRTKVTDACLDDLVRMPSLRTLDIAGTRISEEGESRLKAEMTDCRVVIGKIRERPQGAEVKGAQVTPFAPNKSHDVHTFRIVAVRRKLKHCSLRRCRYVE